MSFNIDGARKAGYSDAEIADHLAKSSGFDAAGARKSGYSDTELIAHLSKASAAPTATQTQSETSIARTVRDFIGPTIEGLGAVGGGVLGTALGPLGAVGGAGLGYGIAKGGLRVLDELAGWEKPPENALAGMTRGAEDVLTGASMEAGGQIVARNVVPATARMYGWGKDYVTGNAAAVKAGTIARDAIGSDAYAIKNALRMADDGMTAAQATADVNSPAWQALAQRAHAHDPRFFGSGPLTASQEAAGLNKLAGLAGGETQTAAITARNAGKQALRERLIPTLDTELAAANTAGQLKPKFDAQANRMSEAAASKVGDVRRFTAAGERAGVRAANTPSVSGMPNTPGRYTYMGDLEKAADRVAVQAADASLPFGEASRFAQAASDSLAAHGLKPLTPESVVGGIKRTLANPEFAGNKDIEKILLSVGDDITKWAKGGGVIDARALDSIRKHSVNTAVNQLSQGMEPAAAKELAAKVSGRLAPMIADAIENAGGTGYKQYLADFAKGRQLIDQQKLGAKALDLFKNNPQGFVDLVEGNSPTEVNKIFGLGKDGYDIAKQMSADAMATLKGTADLTRRGLVSTKQATAGQQALRDIMERDTATFKIPNMLNPKITLTNRALAAIEKKLGVNAMEKLTTGMRNGKSAQEMLSVLPAKDRSIVLSVMQDPSMWIPGGSAAAVNALSMDNR